MTKPVILIVEDEGIVALDLKNKIGLMGFTSIEAISGEEAMKKVKDDRPDLILMDIRLKGDLDGIEVAARIQKRQSIPLIYISALIDEKTKSRASQTNPFAYIEKPFADEILQNAIFGALSGKI